MSSRLFSLAWDGHHKTLINVFETLLEKSNLVDCTITAQGKKLKAHKEVLSAFSPYFELLFKEEHESNPTVILSGVNFEDLKSLIDYMYHGKVEVSDDRVKDLIDVAQCLQIKGLGGAHEEDVAGRSKTTSHFSQRQALLSSVPHKRKRNDDKVVASASSMNVNVNSGDYNYMRLLQPAFSVPVPTAPMGRQTSSFQHLSTNFGESFMQSESSGPNVSLTVQPMLSTEVDNLLVRDVPVVRMEPGRNENESIDGPVVNRKTILPENSGNFCDNIGGETILGLSADVSVMNNNSDPLSTNRVPNNIRNSAPAVLTPSAINATCSRKQIGSFVNNELKESDINLPSSVNPTVSAIETQNLLFHSGSNVKTEEDEEDEVILLEDEDISEENGHSEEIAMIENVRDTINAVEMQGAHNVEKRNEYSGAASAGSKEESLPSLLERSCTSVKRGRETSNAEAQLAPWTFAVSEAGVGAADAAACRPSIFTCPLCQRVFYRSTHLARHARTHSECELYHCQVCDRKFYSAENLETHTRIHQGEKPYRCNECGYATAVLSSLYRHQDIHSGRKPYKCTECDFKSIQSWHLKRHMLIHIKPKRYNCNTCEFQTGRKDHLIVHLQTHEEECQ